MMPINHLTWLKRVLLLAVVLSGLRGETRLLGQVAERSGYMTAIVRELQADWVKNHTVNMVCHGHSVTAGYARTPEVRTFDVYPYLLHRGLCERFPHLVNHPNKRGHTLVAGNLINWFPPVVPTENQPDSGKLIHQ